MLSIIVAKAKNNVIGKNDELIMKLPAESKKFRELTEGKNVIMGRKTLESFPGKRPLPNRINIVLYDKKSFDNFYIKK